MRGRLFLTVVLVVAGVIVAAFNWNAMIQAVTIDLLFVTVTTTVGAIAGLVAATLIVVFLVAGLLDRSRHLEQLSQLERHLDDARIELAEKRATDLAAFGAEFAERLDAFGAEIAERLDAHRAGLDGSLARVEDAVVAHVAEVGSDLGARVDAVRERVVVVRDELAADIAEVEDALLRGRQIVVPEVEADVEDEP